MKKKILALTMSFVLVLSLSACGGNDAKEKESVENENGVYEVATLSNLETKQLADFEANRKKMSEEELYGTSTDESDRSKHLKDVVLKFKKAFYKQYDIKLNSRIKIKGKFLLYETSEKGNIVSLAPSNRGAETISGTTSDDSFNKLQIGDDVTVEALFVSDILDDNMFASCSDFKLVDE